MEIVFLGTGGAWGLPEHSCFCATCQHLRKIGESRTRTSLWLESPVRILVDCGPDIRQQLIRQHLPKPDAVLITHEHGDHYLGLDELLCYKRSLPQTTWKPIPLYAHPKAWPQIEARFGYLLGTLFEKHFAIESEELKGSCFNADFSCVPFKTDHGPFAQGSQGYCFTQKRASKICKVAYTSDMVRVLQPELLKDLDAIILQAHFFNEPLLNRANHLSLQNALPMIKDWQPKTVYFVHLSCQDFRDEDELGNKMLKKYQPKEPLKDANREKYEIPWDQESWQKTVEKVFNDQEIKTKPQVAYDGLNVYLPAK